MAVMRGRETERCGTFNSIKTVFRHRMIYSRRGLLVQHLVFFTLEGILNFLSYYYTIKTDSPLLFSIQGRVLVQVWPDSLRVISRHHNVQWSLFLENFGTANGIG